MKKCEQTITQTLRADGSTITISIGDAGGVGGVGVVGGSAPSGCASQGTNTDSQLTVAGSVSAELGISVGGVGGSAPSGHASQETSADSQLTVAGGVSTELGISGGVVGRDGAGGLETTAGSAQIDSQETHVVSDSWQHMWDADLSIKSPNQSPVLTRPTGKTARNETSSPSQSPVLQRSTGNTARNETSSLSQSPVLQRTTGNTARNETSSSSQSPVLQRQTVNTARNETSSLSQSPVLLLHVDRAGACRGVVSDVFSEPRGGSLVGSGAASEDSIGGVKPAVVATATQSPTSSMAAEGSTGGGTPAVVATSSMAPDGSTGGMETSSPATVLPTSTALTRAIADSNILALVHIPSYLTGLNAQLLAGVPRNARDALDMAGKLPLALKANAIGIPPHELNIDPAQARGLRGRFDAIL